MKRLLQSFTCLAIVACCPVLLAATFTVSNTADSGAGSLRQALLNANATAGKDMIAFNLTGVGPFTISPLSALPIIQESVIIDGNSQPGFNGKPLILLNGASAGASAHGLYLLAGGCLVRGLAIHRFSLDGIRIDGFGYNVIQGNFIGVDATGIAGAGNALGGITLYLSASNLVGGVNAGERNVIVKSGASGVNILGQESHDNRVEGNLIGVNVNGTASLANTNSGVVISDAPRNVIGGTNAAARNIISGNGQSGVYLMGSGSKYNVILGNFIGTDLLGTHSLSNLSDGVTLNNVSSNTVGGSVAGARNVISGNRSRGVIIAGLTARGNQVLGNYIGTDVTGQAKLGNMESGVIISSGVGNWIGGAATLARNLISGNAQAGIGIADTNARLNHIVGNYIGTDSTGSFRLDNSFSGITVSGISNYIGGIDSGAGNLISGNTQNGILISGTNSGCNQFMGNIIGADASGKFSVSNGMCGIWIDTSARNQIGGIQPGAGNLISGNHLLGLYLNGLATRENCIQGNLIGTDVTGALRLGNGSGIGISESQYNIIGGSAWGSRNVISGNFEQGIYIIGNGATANSVLGNFIGSDITGTKALGNGTQGVFLSAPANFIGGSALGAGNLISGNGLVGVSIGDARSSNNVVQGNFIGTQLDGLSPLGNQLHNVEILNTAANNILGGDQDGEGNRIAFAQMAGYDGVRIRAGCFGNIVQGNSIFGNAEMSIDLGDNGVTTNTLGEVNGIQNFPVLTSAAGRFRIAIQGTLNSRINQTFIIDFYVTPDGTPAANGEGQAWLGMTTVQTDASGNAPISASLLSASAVSGLITATATDATGDTSEFSASLRNTFGASVDSDGDGLPDDYELAFGLNPNNPNDALLDSDGDGMNNLAEYRAGTNPQSASEVLRFLPASDINSDLTLLTFRGVEGKKHQVDYAAQVNGPWFPVVTNLHGFGTLLRVADTINDGAPARFYRLKVY